MKKNVFLICLVLFLFYKNNYLNAEIKVNSEGKSNSSAGVDEEDKNVIKVAKKEAKRLGYKIKGLTVHTSWDGANCMVEFYPKGVDEPTLSILVQAETGKILNVEKQKNLK